MNLQLVEQLEKIQYKCATICVGGNEISLKKAVLLYQNNKGTLCKYEEKACIGIEVIGSN